MQDLLIRLAPIAWSLQDTPERYEDQGLKGRSNMCDLTFDLPSVLFMANPGCV